MKKALDQDLIDASDALEHLVKQYDKMTLEEKVDIGARLKGICNNAEKLRKQIGDAMKERVKQKEGTVLGDVFKAVIKLVPIDRLNQTALKEEKPAIYNAYLRNDTDVRVTYEPR